MQGYRYLEIENLNHAYIVCMYEHVCTMHYAGTMYEHVQRIMKKNLLLCACMCLRIVQYA